MDEEPELDPRYRLVRDSSVRVIEPRRGTAFWIDEERLVTCAHVVKGPSGVVRVQHGTDIAEGTVLRITDTEFPDLAVLRVKVDSRYPWTSNHPWARLASRDEALLLEDRLLFYGFADNEQRGGSELIEFRGYAKSMLKLGEGQVRPGHSGSPLVNIATGAVVAVMKRTRDDNTDLGGRAIAIEDLFSLLSSEPMTVHPEWERAFASTLRAPARWDRYRSGVAELAQRDAAAAALPLAEDGFELGGAGFIEPTVLRFKEGNRERIEFEEMYSSIADGMMKHVLVLGHGGSGKSMLLRRVAQRVASDENSRHMVPFLLRAKTVVEATAAGVQSVLDAMLASVAEVRQRLDTGELSIRENHIRDCLRSGRAVVLVDGVDEVDDAAELGRFVQTMTDFIASDVGRRGGLLLASREIAGSAFYFGQMDQLRVGRLESSQITAYLGQWIDQHEIWGLKDHISSELSELLSSPMHLALFAKYLREGARLEDISNLYGEVVINQLSRWRRSSDANPPCDEYEAPLVVETIRKLAFSLLDPERDVHDRIHPTVSDVVRIVGAGQMGHIRKAEMAGLLVRGAGVVSFFHRSVQEALAGAYLASSPNDARRILAAFDERPASLIAMWRAPLMSCADNSAREGTSPFATEAAAWLLARSERDGPLSLRLRMAAFLVSTGKVAETTSLRVVENLLSELPEPSSSRATGALDAALRQRGRGFAPGLMLLAMHEAPAWRVRAAMILSQLGNTIDYDSRIGDVVLTLLGDEVATDQAREAVWAQQSVAAIPLLKTIVQDSYRYARFIACRNLASHVGTDGVRELLERVLGDGAALGDNEVLDVRTRMIAAADGLEAACDNAGELGLSKWALMNLVGKQPRMLRIALYERLIPRLRDEDLPDIVRNIRVEMSDETNEWLIGHENKEVRLACFRGDGMNRASPNARILASALRDAYVMVRREAARRLASLAGEDRAELLRVGLDDPDPETASSTILAMAEADWSGLAPQLAGLLETWEPSHWRQIAWPLVRSGTGALAALTEAVSRTPGDRSARRLDAILSEAPLERGQHVAPFEVAAQSSHRVVQATALRVLGHSRGLDGMPRETAMLLLEDEIPLVRLRAMQAIGPALKPDDGPALRRVAEGSLGDVRGYAIHLLAQLGIYHDVLFEDLAAIGEEDRKPVCMSLGRLYAEGHKELSRGSSPIDVRARLVEIANSRDWDPLLRGYALRQATLPDDETSKSALTGVLSSDTDEGLRGLALERLLAPSVLDHQILESIAVLGDEDEREQAVIRSLSGQCSVEARHVVESFSDDGSDRVRAAVARSMPLVEDGALQLGWALRDPCLVVRKAVAARISEICSVDVASGSSIVRALLQDDEFDVALEAAARCVPGEHVVLLTSLLNRAPLGRRSDVEAFLEQAVAGQEARALAGPREHA